MSACWQQATRALSRRLLSRDPGLTRRCAAQSQLTDEVYAGHVDELAKSLLEKAKNLREYAQRWFSEICSARYAWVINERCAVELRTVTRDELLAFVDAALGAQQARLTIDIRGTKEASGAARNGACGASVEAAFNGKEQPAEGLQLTDVTDWAAFRQRMPLWPALRSTW